MAIVSAAGATVLAANSVAADTAGAPVGGIWKASIHAMTGYFCVAATFFGSGAVQAYVLSNAGVLQGSGFVGAAIAEVAGQASSQYCQPVLMDDGARFLMLYRETGVTVALLPTTGTGFSTLGLAAGDVTSVYMAGFYEYGRVVYIGCMNSAGTQRGSTIWC